jgi:hypothetical protein
MYYLKGCETRVSTRSRCVDYSNMWGPVGVVVVGGVSSGGPFNLNILDIIDNIE